MINTVQSRAAIEAMQSDFVIVPKAQLAEMFDELDLGNQARRVVSSIKATFALAPASIGAAA